MIDAIILFVLGLLIGSFASAVAYRLPRGEDFVLSRSRCPKCGHTLAAIDLIPLVSWLVQGGKCRYCKTEYGVRYLFLELGFAFSYGWIGYFFSEPFVVLLFCVAIFIAYLAVLMRFMDNVTFPLGITAYLLCGVMFSVYQEQLHGLQAIISIIAVGLTLYQRFVSRNVEWPLQLGLVLSPFIWLSLPQAVYVVLFLALIGFLHAQVSIFKCKKSISSEAVMLFTLGYLCLEHAFL